MTGRVSDALTPQHKHQHNVSTYSRKSSDIRLVTLNNHMHINNKKLMCTTQTWVDTLHRNTDKMKDIMPPTFAQNVARNHFKVRCIPPYTHVVGCTVTKKTTPVDTFVLDVVEKKHSGKQLRFTPLTTVDETT
jgi:hypothetical protein